MQILSRRVTSGTTLLVAALVAAGCGQSTEEAEQQLCADLASLRASVATLAASDATTSVEDFQQARENVRQSWADVRDSAANLGDERADDLDDAWDDLEDAFEDVDDDDSLAEAKVQLTQAVGTYDEAAGDIYDGLDCSGDSEGDDDE